MAIIDSGFCFANLIIPLSVFFTLRSVALNFDFEFFSSFSAVSEFRPWSSLMTCFGIVILNPCSSSSSKKSILFFTAVMIKLVSSRICFMGKKGKGDIKNARLFYVRIVHD